MDEATNPLGESDAVDAIAGMLDDVTDEVEQEEQEEVAEPDEALEGADAESEPEPEEPLEEITWNGETKKLAKSELKELAQKGFDYTQKTQELANTRRQFEAAVQAKQQEFALMQQQVDVLSQVKALDSQLAKFQNADWQRMAADDPVQYIQLKQSYDALKEARNEHLAQFQHNVQNLTQRQSQAQQAHLATQAQMLSEKLPEATKAESKQMLKEYLTNIGYSKEEVAGVADHRAVLLAWKAMQYDNLQKSKPALTKKVAEVPKLVKPGTNVPKSPNKELSQTLRKTGRMADAAKLLESML